jgi:hypothetical protein
MVRHGVIFTYRGARLPYDAGLKALAFILLGQWGALRGLKPGRPTPTVELFDHEQFAAYGLMFDGRLPITEVEDGWLRGRGVEGTEQLVGKEDRIALEDLAPPQPAPTSHTMPGTA